MYMFKKDVEILNNIYLLGFSRIAQYLGIHRKTLTKWLKRFPKIPIDREKEIAFIPDLELWYATLIFERSKRGAPIWMLIRKDASIVFGALTVLAKLRLMRLSHPKELKRYLRGRASTKILI